MDRARIAALLDEMESTEARIEGLRRRLSALLTPSDGGPGAELVALVVAERGMLAKLKRYVYWRWIRRPGT